MKGLKINWTKENIQRLALAALFFVIVVYVFFEFLVRPAQRAISGAEQQLTDVDKELRVARGEISSARSLREELETASAGLDDLFANLPPGNPIAWYPPRVENFFKRQGIARCLATVTPEDLAELPGLRVYRCTIDFPEVNFLKFGQALEAFERSDKIFQVTNVRIAGIPTNPEFQQIKLDLRVILGRDES